MKGRFVNDRDGVKGIKLVLETENPDETFALLRFIEACGEPDTLIDSRNWLVLLPTTEAPPPEPSTISFRVLKKTEADA